MIGNALLVKPTEIYTKACFRNARKMHKINGSSTHITGGAFTKLITIKIRLVMILIVYAQNSTFNLWVNCKNRGVKTDEMYKTFNMGVGFCVIAPKNQATKIKSQYFLSTYNMLSQEIGKIVLTKKAYMLIRKKLHNQLDYFETIFN